MSALAEIMCDRDRNKSPSPSPSSSAQNGATLLRAKEDGSASASGKEKGDTNERVVEYLRQRLATVVAAGAAQCSIENPAYGEMEHSRFSMDLSDSDEASYNYEGTGLENENGDDGEGEEAVYPNLRAVSWEGDEVDPAWIIDRYCSWQEEDLEDAMVEEGEGSAHDSNGKLLSPV
jgi:hypothetical protein